MSIRKTISEKFEDEDLLFLDQPEFDAAILGVAERCGSAPVVVYDVDTLIEILAEQGLDQDEAIEHFEFNILGSYVGPRTPMYLIRFGKEEDHEEE